MADYKVFINVTGWPVIRSDKETRSRPCSVCSYVMQQMPHPHSREAMNNYDNHWTMASFINVWAAKTWGRLGCLSIFCNQDLFLLGCKTGVSVEWRHGSICSCPSVQVLSFYSTDKERNTSLWKWDWGRKMISACYNNPQHQRLSWQHL